MPRKSLHSSINNLSYKSLLIILFFLLISIVILWKFVLPNHKVEASWWNDGWNYRKAVSISNTSGSNLTDFQISLSIGTSALIASGKMQSDCDDIRITDINGNLLPYWIETGTCNTDITNIYIKINSLPINGGSLYIYYGNSNTASAIDATAVPQTCSKANSFFGTNFYYINPDGKKDSAPVQAYCDMTTNGGGWTLVASWNTSQEWTKASNSISDVFGTTPKNTVSSNFGNAPINDFRILASDTITSIGTSAYADWYYHYDTITTWKEVWAPTANTGGNITSGYISSTPRQALKPFNYSYSLKFSYQVTQTWNNLSDWGLSANAYYGLPNYWLALTSPGNQFGVYGAVASSGSNDGSLGICPSNSSNCATGQDSGINQTKIGYDDNIPSASFGATATTNVGANPPVDATTKLWWFIRNGTPTSISYTISSISAEEAGGGPIAYWKFDEGSGTTAYDSTSNQNNGVFGSGSFAPTWQNEDMCLSGKCLKFDGVNDFINAGTNPSLNFGTNSFSVFTWVKFNSNSTNQYLINGRSVGSSRWHLYVNSSNVLSFWIADSGGTVASSTIGSYNTNQWYYLGFVRDKSAGKVYFYKDGKLITSVNDSTNNITSQGVYFGAFDGSSYWFNGSIDEPKIYPYARTTDQIKKDYNSRGASSQGTSANLGGAASDNNLSDGLVGYWKMDENVGTSIADSSGLGYTGIFGTGDSAPSWSTGKFGVGTSFDGTNDYINFGNPGLSSLTNATISFWRKASNSNAWLLFQGQTTSHYLMATHGTDAFYHANIGSITKIYVDGNIATTPLTDTNWHHYVITGVNLSTWTNLRLSNYPNFQYNGLIDEIRIYNRALSPSEVSQLYEYAPGPVGYWDFNEGSGTSVTDKSGNNNTGTWSGSGSHWTQGKIGGAGSFNGTNNVVLVPDTNNSLDLPYDFTISFWANSTSSGTKELIAKAHHENYEFYQSGTNLVVRINGDSSAITASNFFTYGQWTYITIKYERSTGLVNVYKDGVYFTSGTNTNSAVINNSSTQIGAYYDGTSYPFLGKIDDVKIYNYARTQKQIIEDMNGNRPAASSKSPIAYYKFDEGYGTSVIDWGLGKNNGTFTGSTLPTWSNNGKINKAVNFDNTTGSITMGDPTNEALDPGTNDFTISYWIKTNPSSTWILPIYKGGSSINTIGYDFELSSATHKLNFNLADSNSHYYTVTTSSSIDDNNWHHIVGVIDRSGALGTPQKSHLFVDGKEEGTPVNISLLESLSNSYSFDISKAGYTIKGLIDDVKIYKYALTAEDIKQDYNQNSALQMGQTSQTIGGTTTSLEYCIPGDTSYCAAPVGEWKMDEGSGTSAKDTSGNNLVGTITGATWTQGKIGSALSFDGNDFVGTGNTTSYTSSLTVEGWFKQDQASGNERGIITKYTSSFQNGSWTLETTSNGSRLLWDINDGAQKSCTTPISVGQWYYAVGIYTGSKGYLYLNGVLKCSFDVGAINTLNDEIRIGYAASGLFSGNIDGVKIYNYARTPAQIAYDYNKGGPVGWWKLDECQGNIAYDWSGIGNTGTIIIGASGTQNSLGTCAVGTSAAWTNGSTGKLNSSLNFDGTDDYVSVNNSTTFNLNQNMSISVWVKLNTLLNHAYPLNNGQYQFYQRGDWAGRKIYFMWKLVENVTSGDSAWGYFAGVSSISNLEDGKWYHLVGVRNGNNLLIYVNGKKEKENSSLSGYTPSSSASNLVFGNPFNGQIDDVKVYNYALTDTQVKTLYNNGAVNFN